MKYTRWGEWLRRVDKSHIFFPHVWKLRQKRKKRKSKGNWSRGKKGIEKGTIDKSQLGYYTSNLLNRNKCAQPLPFSCHPWKHCMYTQLVPTTRNSLFVFSINTADMDWDLAKTQPIQQQQRNMPHVAEFNMRLYERHTCSPITGAKFFLLICIVYYLFNVFIFVPPKCEAISVSNKAKKVTKPWLCRVHRPQISFWLPQLDNAPLAPRN